MTAEPAFPPDQPLQGVLRRVSAHLDHLASMAHEVEHAIADELASGSQAQTSGNVGRLQNLDFLRQYTEDLALLTLYLSQLERMDTLPGHQAVTLSQRVRLERTRALLFPNAEPVTQDITALNTGDVDLF